MTAAPYSELEVLRQRVADLEAELVRVRRTVPPPESGIEPGVAEREALLDEAERAAQMGTWIWDLSDNSVVWSKQLFRILGYDAARDAATVEAFYAAVHPDDRARLMASSAKIGEVGEATPSYASMMRLVHVDGTVRECLVTGVRVSDQTGAQSRLIGAIVDLTDRRRAERNLRRSERMLKEAQRVAHVGSWVFDLASQTLEWSEELFRIFGVDPSTRPTLELFRGLIHPEDRPRVLAGADGSPPLGAGVPIECRIVRPSDREVRHVQIASQLLTDESGAIAGLVGTSLDITERRRLEEQLLHSQKLEAVGRLAGGVAHDFNNMLTAIFGNTELASRRVPAGSVVADHLAQIRTAADRAAALTRQLLAFARKQIIQPSVFDPNALVFGVEPLLRPLVGKDVELDLLPSEGVWPIRIDRGQFEQLLINLAVNARDAMPDGGRLTIALANVTTPESAPDRCPELPPGDYVELTVTDTGHGIDDAIQRHVFEPFFTTKELGKGSGLGLATCHGIVKQHGGHIWFRSASGCGTRFTICFPRVHAAPVDAAPSTPSPASGGTETLLFVDDEVQVRELGTTALQAFGYVVLTARSGKEAIAIAATHQGAIDLLVTDVALPDMRGPELAAAVGCARRGLPVVFASGYTEDATLHDGDAPFLQKPYTPTQLAKAVRRALDAAGHPRAAKGALDSVPPISVEERLP